MVSGNSFLGSTITVLLSSHLLVHLRFWNYWTPPPAARPRRGRRSRERGQGAGRGLRGVLRDLLLGSLQPREGDPTPRAGPAVGSSVEDGFNHVQGIGQGFGDARRVSELPDSDSLVLCGYRPCSSSLSLLIVPFLLSLRKAIPSGFCTPVKIPHGRRMPARSN